MAGRAAESTRAYRSHTAQVLGRTEGIAKGFVWEATWGVLESGRLGEPAACPVEADVAGVVVAEDVVEEVVAVQATMRSTIRMEARTMAAAADLAGAYT